MYKKEIIMIFMTLIVGILSISIVFGSYNTEFSISGEAIFTLNKNIRITEAKLIETTGNSVIQYTPTINGNTVVTGSNLNSLDSTMKYEIEITNLGNVAVRLDGINITPENSNIIYDIEGIKTNEVIKGFNKKKNFTITFKYSPEVNVLPETTLIENTIFLNFEKIIEISELSIGEVVNYKIDDDSTWRILNKNEETGEIILVLDTYVGEEDINNVNFVEGDMNNFKIVNIETSEIQFIESKTENVNWDIISIFGNDDIVQENIERYNVGNNNIVSEKLEQNSIEEILPEKEENKIIKIFLIKNI